MGAATGSNGLAGFDALAGRVEAEVTEGAEGVSDTVIQNWYNSVYEPSGELNLTPTPIELPGGTVTM